ncbi:restriction endonuclease subunit S [Methylobacillus flagellatus]|uniref:Restriction modification system DNA specificity domain n=1 Tax=Methylobacillus flagellatus (strain ATCC 51484 / DSM 6875 / VKM B-1610 / KT) TaxID=265072 RepID=Q1H243_METFK|nr:restriction endonuclease subunit S [Methylobacillus flagellatus]ABE49444.1 restriction modification system DNA specificity domain [Methylobacillus flagellatus KT]
MTVESWATESVADCLVPVSVTGKAKIQSRDYKPSGRFPVIDQGQEPIAGWTDDESAVIDTPLPLIVFGDHTRVFKFLDTPFARGADGTQLLRPKPGIDPLFFFYACRAVDLPARGYNRHFTILKEKEISYPSSDGEQKAIAAVLRQTESALVQQSSLLDMLQELKRATLGELFSRGLRAEAQKETEIGLMPESWSPRTILELCEIWSGGTPRKSVTEYWNGDIPWVSGKDLKRPALDDAIDHVSAAGVEAGSRLAPEGAVLLLVRGMGLAKDLPVAVINRAMAFNQDVKALVTRGEYSGQFLRSAIYAGKERLLSQIVPSAHGTMTLNLNDVETFKVACPSDPDEAKDIVTILHTLDRKIDLHQTKCEVLEELFESLLRKLMTGEIAVSDLDLSALSPASTQHEEATA